MEFDVVIVGGGPAGAAAAVYAARKGIRVGVAAERFGGQTNDTMAIENYISVLETDGPKFALALEAQVRHYDVDIMNLQRAEKLIPGSAGGYHELRLANGAVLKSKAVIVATGARWRELNVPGEQEFRGKGVAYCPHCDGPLFKGKHVAVVGGGNAGFETVAQLLAYCKSVTLIHRQPDFIRADKATVDAVLAHPNMKTIVNATPVEVKGDTFVKSISVKDNASGAITEIPVVAVFVEIGMVPATGPVKDLVELDPWGKIKVDAKNQRASVPGVWAAGDCTDGLYHQNNIAAGDAVKALEDIYLFLNT